MTSDLPLVEILLGDRSAVAIKVLDFTMRIAKLDSTASAGFAQPDPWELT
jgi:hypothetical protein